MRAETAALTRAAWLIALAAASVAAAVFWPVLQLGFVWDDVPFYLSVPALHDAADLGAGIFGQIYPGLNSFRPVAMASFKLQFLLFGHSPVAAHAIGLALHAANTALVALLAARLAPGRVRPLLAGLLYGLHPVLVEPVAWMSCRFDSLVTFWLLLALHADFALGPAPARAAAVGALYFLALCSKEMAAPFPAVLALVQLATRYAALPWREALRRGLRREGPVQLALAAALAAYLALRAHFIGNGVNIDADVAAELTGLPERLALVAGTLLFHLRNVLLPFAVLCPLHPLELPSLAFTAADLPALAGAALLGAVLAWGIRRRQPALVLVAAGVVSLLLVLNVLLPLSIARNIGHERYLTFPLVLFVLAVAVTPLPQGARAPLGRVITALLLGPWLLAAVANDRVTIPLWRSDVSLWNWALQRTGSDYALYSLVVAQLDAGRPELAEAALGAELPQRPYHGLSRLLLARWWLEHGEPARGEAQLRIALREFPPWHAAPPRDARARRELEDYGASVGGGYARLAQIDLAAGRGEAARAQAAIALVYTPDEAIARGIADGAPGAR